MEKLELGPVPSNEDCEQLGPNYNPQKARKECSVLIQQLRRMFGEEPAGARLFISSNPHDFGTYLEVAVKFDENDEEATDYALRLENEYPENWDAQAEAQLLPKFIENL